MNKTHHPPIYKTNHGAKAPDYTAQLNLIAFGVCAIAVVLTLTYLNIFAYGPA